MMLGIPLKHIVPTVNIRNSRCVMHTDNSFRRCVIDLCFLYENAPKILKVHWEPSLCMQSLRGDVLDNVVIAFVNTFFALPDQSQYVT